MSSNIPRGSVHLFRFRGLDLYIHCLWLLLPILYLPSRACAAFQHRGWGVAVLLGSVTIVLLHELGHVVACRMVGGKADEVLLWPLGGIAFVDPPRRADGLLITILGGPLVNVALMPLLMIADMLALSGASSGFVSPDMLLTIRSLVWINAGILAFNLLPIYPLDGGQIVQALLWFKLGADRSLRYVALAGLTLAPALAAVAIYTGSFWLIAISVFLGIQAQRGFTDARATLRETSGATLRDVGRTPRPA